MSKLKDFENSDNAQCIWKEVKIFLTGLLGLSLFVAFVALSLPIYLYRWLLANILVKSCLSYFPNSSGDIKNVVKPVSAVGNIFATEFLRNLPPRNAIVSNFVVEGESFDRDELRQLIQRRWIDGKVKEVAESSGLEKDEELKYPELQQYIEYWMGFMFWKWDKQFDLNNHLIFHKIPETSSLDENNNGADEDATSEKFLCSLMEDLLNKPFPPTKSPWEIHVLENYKNSKLSTVKNTDSLEQKKMTAFVLRFHHGLADGFSLLYALVEGLFGQSVSDISLAQESPSSSSATKPEPSLLNIFVSLFQLIYDIGQFSVKIVERRSMSTPWHVPDRKKKWLQIYNRSDLISIDKLKQIKNRFGVTFTGTLLSCLSAGVQKSLEKNGNDIDVEEMTALSPLPLPGHPKRFRNHVTAAIFDLPTSSHLNSLERLFECERKLQRAKQSALPLFGVYYAKLVGSHLATVARKLLYNSVIPMGLTNFPGPGKAIYWNGREGLAADFVAGAVTGVAGVGFMVLSYRGYIRISVSAENAIMDRKQVNELIGFVCEEIDKLHALSESPAPV